MHAVNILPGMATGTAGAGKIRPVDPIAASRTRARIERAAAAPWLHQEAARRMGERLPLIRRPPHRVIDAWAHAGGSSDALRAALPQAQVERWGPRPPVGGPAAANPAWWRRWLPGLVSPQAGEFEATGAPADMVWANMQLHHETDPLPLLGRWFDQLAVGGFLMFSTLGPGSLGSLRQLYQAQGWGAPMAELVDMHDIGDMLVEAGFADPVMDQEVIRLTWSKAEDALLELRSLGSNIEPAREPGLRTPRWRQRLLKGLESVATLSGTGRIQLEFELVYGHAFKPEPRYLVAPETHIAWDDLRNSLKRPRPGPPA